MPAPKQARLTDAERKQFLEMDTPGVPYWDIDGLLKAATDRAYEVGQEAERAEVERLKKALEWVQRKHECECYWCNTYIDDILAADSYRAHMAEPGGGGS